MGYKKSFCFIFLSLIILFGFVGLVGAATLTVNSDFTNEQDVIVDAADRLIETQNNDGGWDWGTPNDNPDDTSPVNTIGVTAQGTLDAYVLTGEEEYLDTAIDAYDYTDNLADLDERIRGPDIPFLVELSEITDDNDYADLAKERYEDILSTYGSATSWAKEIRDIRVGQGWETLVSWDINLYIQGALALDRYYPGEGFDDDAEDMVEVIYNYLYVDEEFDFSNESQEAYWLTYTGAVEAFTTTNSYTSERDSLIADLKDSQQTDGSFVSAGESDTQTTAYAIMALLKSDEIASANEGKDWLIDNQEENGGWIEVDDEEYTEVGSEAIQAIFDYIYSMYHTVQEALDDASEGDTIELRSGTYEVTEQISTKLNNFTIKAADGETPVLEAQSSFNCSTSNYWIIRMHYPSEYSTIEGLKILGNGYACGGIYVKGNNNSIKNNEIEGVLYHGIMTSSSPNLGYNTIYGNDISNVQNGIALQNDENYVDNNIINTIKSGFSLASKSTNWGTNTINVAEGGAAIHVSLYQNNYSSKYSGSIQDAINGANLGDTIDTDPGTFVEDLVLDKGVTIIGNDSNLNGKVSMIADNSALKDFTVSSISLSGTGSSKAAIYVSASNILVENCTVEDITGTGGGSIEAIYLPSSSSSNISLLENTIRNIYNSDRGSYGIMVQGILDNISVKGNIISDITSEGWAHAIEVTPTCASTIVPKNVVIEDNSISDVSAPSDAVGFSVDWCDSSEVTADASEVIFSNNNLNSVLVRNLDSNSLNAQYNYWGSASPDFENLIYGNVIYAPWFTDGEMTTSTIGQTEPVTDPETNLTESTITEEVTLSDGEISVTLPEDVVVSTTNSSWDGTINPPTIKEEASVEPSTPGLNQTVSKVIEVGFSGTKLIFSKAVKIVIPGETGKKVGYSYEGIFYPIPLCIPSMNETNLPEGGNCYYDDGTDIIIWTKHFTEFMTFEETDPNVPDLEYYWYTPDFLRPGEFLNFFARFSDPSGVAYVKIRYIFTAILNSTGGSFESTGYEDISLIDGDVYNGTWSPIDWPTPNTDGYYQIRLRANDSSGEDNEYDYPSSPDWLLTVTIDGTEPNTTLSLNGSNYGDFITSSTQVILNSTDPDLDDSGDYNDSGVNYTEYKIDSGDYEEYSTYFTISGEDGAHTVYYYSTDNAGNIETTKEKTLILDNTAPSVSIIYPVNGKIYDSPINQLNYSASDSGSGLSSCWYNNGTTNSTPGACSNFTLSDSVEGENNWAVYANDSVGNLNSSTVYFIQDTIFPSVSYNADTPEDNSYLNENSILINVSVTEENLDSVVLSLDNVNESISENDGAGNYWINKIGLSEGSHSFYVWANDSVGHLNSTETRTVIIDTTNPLISYAAGTPENNANLSQDYIYLNVSLTESNFANITFSLYNSTGTVNSTSYNTEIKEINWTSLDEGRYSYDVTVYDLAGNVNSTETREILLDTTGPVIVITNIKNGDNIFCFQSVTADINDNGSGIDTKSVYATISNSTNTIANQTMIYDSSRDLWDTTFSGLCSEISVGNYTIKVTAYDIAGNINLDEKDVYFPTVVAVFSEPPTCNVDSDTGGTCTMEFSFWIRGGNAVTMSMSDIEGEAGSLSPTEVNAVIFNDMGSVTVGNVNATGYPMWNGGNLSVSTPIGYFNLNLTLPANFSASTSVNYYIKPVVV